MSEVAIEHKGSTDEERVNEQLAMYLREMGQVANELTIEQYKQFRRTGQGFKPWMLRFSFRHMGAFWMLCPVCNAPNWEHDFTGHTG